MRSGERGGGFTLVEVVVALVVLAVATAATAELLYRASRSGREADHRERLLWEAGHLADSLAGVPGAMAGSRLLPDGTCLEWSGVADGGWIRATPPLADTPWIALPVSSRTGRTTLGSSR